VKCYFHCDTNMYRRKAATLFGFIAPPIFLAAVIAGVCLWVCCGNLAHAGFLAPVLTAVTALLFAAAVFARVLLEITERKTADNARYTYVEIGLKDVIISVYAGSYTMYGERTVIRRLYVMPFKGFRSAVPGEDGRVIVKADTIRSYAGNSKRLGYRFVNGEFRFSEPYYELAGFSEIKELAIPNLFGAAKRLVREINAANTRFRELPPEKPYTFRESPLFKPKRHKSTQLF